MPARLSRRRAGDFDTFLFADYSGAADAAGQRAAISLFRLDRSRGRPRKAGGPFTRATLRVEIVRQLESATLENRRVLFGIDHQWSWPMDLLRAARVHDLGWRAALARLVKGGPHLPPLGPPSRYAAAFNGAAGAEIFYSRVRSFASRYGIPSNTAWPGRAVRLTETLMPGAKPSNRLGGTGAVGGQTIFGLIELHHLFAECARRELPVVAWPFEVSQDDRHSHVGCEIYPGHAKKELARRGLLRRDSKWSDHDFDAASVCLWASSTDLGPLLDLSAAPESLRTAARLEGWILGAPNRIANTNATV